MNRLTEFLIEEQQAKRKGGVFITKPKCSLPTTPIASREAN